MKELIAAIEQGEQVRNSLSDLVLLVKTEGKDAFYEAVGDVPTFIYKLFTNDDPKVRKNAAKLCELLPDTSLIGILWEAYAKEGTYYVRPCILEGFKGKDVTELKPDFRQRRDMLLQMEVSDENKKHVLAEIQAYNDLLLTSVLSKHRYVTHFHPVDVILTCGLEQRDVVLESIDEEKKKAVGPGIMVRTERVEELFYNRLFKEMLFALSDLKALPEDPYELAEKVAASKLLDFLKLCHEGDSIWRYRVNLRTNWDDKKKSLFIKRFAGELQRESMGALVNDGANYEMELRIVPSNSNLRVLIKLFTLKDERFNYRVKTVAQSIHPTDAALMMKLCEPYLRKNSQVLDPFCGVGTMLVERNEVSSISPVYGIDTFGEAIEKAEFNCKKAGLRVNFIHRDFFDFKHDYLFDEIITNMPFSMEADQSKIAMIYRAFFVKAKEHLKEDGVICLYSRNPSLVKSGAKENGYTIKEQFLIHEKEQAYVYVLTK